MEGIKGVNYQSSIYIISHSCLLVDTSHSDILFVCVALPVDCVKVSIEGQEFAGASGVGAHASRASSLDHQPRVHLWDIPDRHPTPTTGLSFAVTCDARNFRPMSVFQLEMKTAYASECQEGRTNPIRSRTEITRTAFIHRARRDIIKSMGGHMRGAMGASARKRDRSCMEAPAMPPMVLCLPSRSTTKYRRRGRNRNHNSSRSLAVNMAGGEQTDRTASGPMRASREPQADGAMQRVTRRGAV